MKIGCSFSSISANLVEAGVFASLIGINWLVFRVGSRMSRRVRDFWADFAFSKVWLNAARASATYGYFFFHGDEKR